MIPTPDTSHVPYARVYEPAEDSFLFIDTLFSPNETAFLRTRFSSSSASSPLFHSPPLLVEVGPGSGVVLAALTAHAHELFGSTAALTAGIDVNGFACKATNATVRKAVAEATQSCGGSAVVDSDGHGAVGAPGSALFLGALRGDLLSSMREGQVDVLVFNPPYVPTEELPVTDAERDQGMESAPMTSSARFEQDSRLLALAYAGGRDGMQVTDRLLAEIPRVLSSRGCAYVLLCAGNRPKEVKRRIKEEYGPGWEVATVGDSGKTAGWEKLQIIRIWRVQ